jgi:endonuclease/exonuclease/phosphatase (EEP) superfamily protein YafD
MTPAGRVMLGTITRAIWWTLTALALPAGLLNIAAYFTTRPVVLAQLSPFRVQAGALLLAHLVFCLVLRRRRWAALFATIALFNVWAVLRPAIPEPINACDSSRPPLKILFANVLSSNSDPAPLLALIASESPDLIALVEVNHRWQSQLAPVLARDYPHSTFHSREDNFGLAVFTRDAFANIRLVAFADPEIPSLDLALRHGDRDFRFVVTHTLPPGDTAGSELRARHLAALGRWFADATTPALAPSGAASTRGESPLVFAVGDFNATPWCPSLRRLIAAARLHLAARGHAAVAATWPVAVPFLRIPLDHALLSESLVCTAYRVGPDIGSDHFPIILEIQPAAPLQ